FSLDGFGLGMPKTFITQNKWLHKGYSWLRDRIERRLEDPTIVTRWPAFVAGIAMRPNEIVFVAEKVKEIAVSERRGYELVSEERTQQRNWAGVGSRA